MTFKEEALKLRIEARRLRQDNARFKRRGDLLISKVVRLETENHTLHQENTRLQQTEQQLLQQLEHQRKQIESLNLIVEELRRIVFGQKKTVGSEDKNGSNEGNTPEDQQTGKRQAADRSKESYRRAVPSNEEVTDTYDHLLTHCPDCGTLLIQLKQIARYLEDIADLTKLSMLLKRIEKHLIDTGYCPTCKRRKAAIDISPQVSTLGDNVRQFVCYLSIIMRLSFEQIKSFLSDTAGLDISDGEITAILDEQSQKLTPERNRLLTLIRGAPGEHYDETPWRVQRERLGNYAWISRPTIGEETVFLMGRSRGKGNAEELRGEVDNQVGITDDYGAYDNLFNKHQLCMAHPHRKLRDLAESKILFGASKFSCIKSYQAFSSLYEELKETLAGDYRKDVWLKKLEEYTNRLQRLAIITDNDPEKLKAIKKSLVENAEKYFTCLEKPGIPCDNNKAERGLRHIVLKRKASYGSKTQKGADTMSILCSTLLSAWWSKPDNFFTAYKQMLTV